MEFIDFGSLIPIIDQGAETAAQIEALRNAPRIETSKDKVQ